MEADEPVLAGPLVIPSNKKSKKHPPPKYCMLFKSSKSGIERLEIYDHKHNFNETEAKIIPLNNCIKITEKSPVTFRVTTKSEVHDFEAANEEEKQKWLLAIQSVAFPDDSSQVTTIEEDNDLYCSAGEGIYNVKVLSTPASVKCKIDNKHFTLVLTPVQLELRSATGAILFTWPYCFIRKYGVKNGTFTFEAGRKCTSGEGVFLIEHPNKEEIFRLVGLKMKSMKKRLSADNTMLNADPNDLQLAMSMEARSRSPIVSKTSNFSFKDKLESQIKEKPPAPHKPPRKVAGYQATYQNTNNSPDYEPIDGYDRVECRNDAWRTMGVDNVSHNEALHSNDEGEETYASSWGGADGRHQRRQQTTSPSKFGPKILTQKTPTDESYDTLNFFGSTTKLNVSSSYKQVTPAPIAPVVEPPAFNLYDEVENCLLGVRLADDSHLGYAQIRKEPQKGSSSVNHQFHNEDAYAVISKPKQV